MFSDVYCKCILSGCVAYVFTHMLQVFYLNVAYICNGFELFFQVFFASILEACFKCFICLETYVASVASGCFKSRSGVAHGMCMESRRGREDPTRSWAAWATSGRSGGCVLARARVCTGHVGNGVQCSVYMQASVQFGR
jgi:hypothetical protein